MSTTSNGNPKGSSRPSNGKITEAVDGIGPADGATSRLRIIIADSEAIFRVGMSKIFAAQPDLEVVAQTETLSQTLNGRRIAACEVPSRTNTSAPVGSASPRAR